jgi:hypothetical protein
VADHFVRWWGLRPLTWIVLGVVVVVIIACEVFWLYTPFGSTSPRGVPTGSTSGTAPDGTSAGLVDQSAGSTETSAVPEGAYRTLATVAIRSGPTTADQQLGKIPKGTDVVITCTVVGQPVKGATRTDAHWDKVTVGAITGYVANLLVDTGAAIDDPTRIPPC